MAYVSFAEGELLQAPRTSSAQQPGFSALEWSVIALARRDPLSSLNQPGRVAKALASLFGLWRDSSLADGRLEALRRMAILAWRNGYAVPVSELRAFKAAGFSDEQYDVLQASIARGRAQSQRRSA
jgi:hypothetical protein